MEYNMEIPILGPGIILARFDEKGVNAMPRIKLIDSDVSATFYHDVGEISVLSQSEALNLVMWRVRFMQPMTPSPWTRGPSWLQFNVQENGSMKCY